MDYRSERDSLRERVENLEQELGEAKKDLDAQQGGEKAARVAQLEQSSTYPVRAPAGSTETIPLGRAAEPQGPRGEPRCQLAPLKLREP